MATEKNIKRPSAEPKRDRERQERVDPAQVAKDNKGGDQRDDTRQHDRREHETKEEGTPWETQTGKRKGGQRRCEERAGRCPKDHCYCVPEVAVKWHRGKCIGKILPDDRIGNPLWRHVEGLCAGLERSGDEPDQRQRQRQPKEAEDDIPEEIRQETVKRLRYAHNSHWNQLQVKNDFRHLVLRLPVPLSVIAEATPAVFSSFPDSSR